MLQELSLDKIATLTQGKILAGKGENVITHISIDSRQIISPEKTLFVALRGAKADGSDFIPVLGAQGVAAFLVHDDYELEEILNGNSGIVAVQDTRKALQALAK